MFSTMFKIKIRNNYFELFIYLNTDNPEPFSSYYPYFLQKIQVLFETTSSI